MRIGPFDFRPSLWPSLATLALLPVLVGLVYVSLWLGRRMYRDDPLWNQRAEPQEVPAP